MHTDSKWRWWQRHPFVGLAIGWAAIALGADLVALLLRH
jgi:hypothetical protein